MASLMIEEDLDVVEDGVGLGLSRSAAVVETDWLASTSAMARRRNSAG